MADEKAQTEDRGAILSYLQGRKARLERALNRVTAKAEGVRVELAALEAKIEEMTG